MKSVLSKLKTMCTKGAVWPFLGLGLASQAPVNLIGGTLKYWFRTEGVNLGEIGLFGLVLIPYTLKFLWAPFIDQINLPFATQIGRKKVWGLLTQVLLMIALFMMSMASPKQNLIGVFIVCLTIAFASATQDIVIDALRIDTLEGDELKEGTSAYQLGARLGMLGTVAGMIFLSDHVSWQTAYQISIIGIVLGFISLCFVHEKKAEVKTVNFQELIIDPFKDFILRNKHFGLLCLFVVAYKLCNGVLGPMAYPFYYDVGFSAKQISIVSGTFGVFVTMFGVVLGGIAMLKCAYRPLLFRLGFIEIFTSIAFAGLALGGPNMPFFIEEFMSKITGVQACLGPSLFAFFAVILFDNILAGMGGAVWVAYLSSLCNRKFSGTQYAFLTALNMVPLSVIASSGGFLAQNMGWPMFFMFTGVLMIPALFMLKKCDPLFQR